MHSNQEIFSLDIIDTEGHEIAPAITPSSATGKPRKLYIESYGCQMNYSDSEIVSSIMAENGYDTTNIEDDADLVFINTCAIRENAEQKIRNRLVHLNGLKNRKPGLIIGVLGCMAERLKSKLLEEEKMVDMVVGPDAYRTLPALVNQVDEGHKAVNVFLSREETYGDITPTRLNSNGITAFISIMRGCDNMCSFCVVPYTRGRERSRDATSIVAEAVDLFKRGFREVTLLGQNVDSYKWADSNGNKINFANLLALVADIDPLLRVRFSTSHPKDITDEVLHTIKAYENICNYIHLPAQSGSTRVLDLMNRTYTRNWYLDRINAIRSILTDGCGISTDMITGFCTETEEDHQDTMTLMDIVSYDYAYMFCYSERPGTPAAKKLVDDIDAATKQRRLAEVITLQGQHSLARNKSRIGKTYKVLIEGPSKKSDAQQCGRTTENTMVVFDASTLPAGSYVDILIDRCTGATLFGTVSKLYPSS